MSVVVAFERVIVSKLAEYVSVVGRKIYNGAGKRQAPPLHEERQQPSPDPMRQDLFAFGTVNNRCWGKKLHSIGQKGTLYTIGVEDSGSIVLVDSFLVSIYDALLSFENQGAILVDK
jgi:hypothetical protein